MNGPIIRFIGDLRRIRASIAAIAWTQLGPIEAVRQLEIQQRSVMRGIVQLGADATGLQSSILPKDEADLLPAWERLSETLRQSNPTIPPVNEVSDFKVLLIGAQRSLHFSPEERIAAWVAHA